MNIFLTTWSLFTYWRSSRELKGGAMTVKLLSCHMYMTFAHAHKVEFYLFFFCYAKKLKSITFLRCIANFFSLVSLIISQFSKTLRTALRKSIVHLGKKKKFILSLWRWGDDDEEPERNKSWNSSSNIQLNILLLLLYFCVSNSLLHDLFFFAKIFFSFRCCCGEKKDERNWMKGMNFPVLYTNMLHCCCFCMHVWLKICCQFWRENKELQVSSNWYLVIWK